METLPKRKTQKNGGEKQAEKDTIQPKTRQFVSQISGDRRRVSCQNISLNKNKMVIK